MKNRIIGLLIAGAPIGIISYVSYFYFPELFQFLKLVLLLIFGCICVVASMFIVISIIFIIYSGICLLIFGEWQ